LQKTFQFFYASSRKLGFGFYFFGGGSDESKNVKTVKTVKTLKNKIILNYIFYNTYMLKSVTDSQKNNLPSPDTENLPSSTIRSEKTLNSSLATNTPSPSLLKPESDDILTDLTEAQPKSKMNFSEQSVEKSIDSLKRSVGKDQSPAAFEGKFTNPGLFSDEETDDENNYMEISMNENNKELYNENVLKELGVNAEVSIVFRTTKYKTNNDMVGGGEPVYEQITIPYRYFYTGLKNISNLFVFSKPTNYFSSERSVDEKKNMSNFLSYTLKKSDLPSDAPPPKPLKWGFPNLAFQATANSFSKNENIKKSPLQNVEKSPEQQGIISKFFSYFKSSSSKSSDSPERSVGEDQLAVDREGKLPLSATKNVSSSTLLTDEKINKDSIDQMDKTSPTPTDYNSPLPSSTPDPEETLTIRIKLIGKMQDLDYSYIELLQERLWIEKALSLKLFFDEYKVYKINNKIILIGELKSTNEFFNDCEKIEDIENEVRHNEFKRFNSLYPGVLNRIKNTELYKKILYRVS
jgi:hypothetical protein